MINKIINDKLISISQLAKQLNLVDKKTKKPSTHTLRFWESKFKQIKPTIITGRRYYSNKDVETIKLINFLLKEKGLTITGAKKILSEKTNKLDASGLKSIKTDYFKEMIKNKSEKILKRIKKLNG